MEPTAGGSQNDDSPVAGTTPSLMGSPTKAELAAQIAALRKSLAREKAKRTRSEAAALEAREQQAVAAEILHVISSSLSDAQPVFDAIVASATRLCEA